MIVIFGNSGHAKELEFIIRDNQEGGTVIDYFVVGNNQLTSNSKRSNVITEAEFKKNIDGNKNIVCYIGVGNGVVRKNIWSDFSKFDHISFPNLLHKNFLADFDFFEIGIGNVFMFNSIVTTEIAVGNHNHFNIGVSISHNCEIGNFNTLSPGVRLAGNVSIGSNNFFGVNATVIDKIRISDNITVGAGAVVINDLIEPGTYVGVPAKKIR